LGIIDEILYAHPKDIQDGKISVTENDVLANVPFVEGCGLWFDHHSSEQERLELDKKYNGACEPAPSAARVVYNYYKSDPGYRDKLDKFDELIEAVDIADSARFSKEDIVNPQGWIMLAFITDPRTGLGYHRTFRISNFDLMKTLPQLLRTKSVDEILAMQDFKERIDVYKETTEKYKQFIESHSRTEGDAIIIDLRGETDIPSGNRFVEYIIYSEQNISIRLTYGKGNESVMLSVGHSVINRTSGVDVGSIVLKYGGGGHKKVGTCQVGFDDVDKVLNEILQAINSGQ
jgi:oligoribonuclease NrnB/cAMP/cGMP phosphodiesterase (DHH superfamily)